MSDDETTTESKDKPRGRGRPRTGSICRDKRGRPRAVLVTLADGSRKRIPLPKGCSERMAQEKRIVWSRRAATVEAGEMDPRFSARREERARNATDEWFRAFLADRARRLSGHDNAEGHLRNHVRPVTGDKHIREWTVDDCRRIVASLDDRVAAGEMSAKTAINIWTTVRAALKAACKSKREALRCRDDNPALMVEGPDRAPPKQKQFLQPAELLAFAVCGDVPLAYRRQVVLSAYLYCRPGELKVLRWRDLDLEGGIARVHRAYNYKSGGTKATKTSSPRDFAIERALLPLLRLMRAESDSELVVPEMGDLDHLTKPFREALLLAGVDRPELHEAEATSKAVTYYDLRATGITWRAIRGDEPLHIMHDAGHKNFGTTQGYIRRATPYRDNPAFGQPFPQLPSALIGDRKSAFSNGDFRSLRKNYKDAAELLCEGGDSNPHSQSGH